jgi:hypothetical protein
MESVYIELLVHCLLRYMLLLFDILYVTLLRLLFLFLFFGGRRGGGGGGMDFLISNTVHCKYIMVCTFDSLDYTLRMKHFTLSSLCYKEISTLFFTCLQQLNNFYSQMFLCFCYRGLTAMWRS